MRPGETRGDRCSRSRGVRAEASSQGPRILPRATCCVQASCRALEHDRTLRDECSAARVCVENGGQSSTVREGRRDELASTIEDDATLFGVLATLDHAATRQLSHQLRRVLGADTQAPTQGVRARAPIAHNEFTRLVDQVLIQRRASEKLPWSGGGLGVWAVCARKMKRATSICKGLPLM